MKSPAQLAETHLPDNLYQTIVENSLGFFSLTDLKGTLIYHSPSYTRILGYPRNSLVGKSFTQVTHRLDIKHVREMIRQSKVKGQSPRITIRLLHASGTIMYVKGRAVRIQDKQINRTRILFLFKDITELHKTESIMLQNEQSYHQLVDVSPEAIAVHSGGALVYVNQAGAKLVGAAKSADIIGTPILNFVHPDYHEIVKQRIRKIYEEGIPTDLLEEKFIKLDGSVIDVEVISIPFLYRDKPSVQIVVRDITERKKIETQRDEFLAIASHELKTPITTIKAFAQLLQRYFRQSGDKKATLYLSKMDNQLNNLTSLIQDLLDVSKMQAGKMKYNKEYFNLEQLVNEIVEDMELTTPYHRIKKIGLHTGLVHADKYRIAQVLINLLSNAVKYTPNGGDIFVTISSDKTHVTVAVTDEGIGIAEDQKDVIFDRFYRISDKTHESYPGLGLGLYISGEIIKRHEGIFTVRSEIGKGSTFAFSLPFKPASKKYRASARKISR